MKKPAILLLVTVLAWFSLNAHAGKGVCDEAEKRMENAAEAYLKNGVSGFVNAMLRGGALVEDKRSVQAQTQGLQQVESLFGAFQSVSVISSEKLGSRLCYLAMVLEYEDGPAYAVASFYRGKQDGAVTGFTFNTDPASLFPAELLFD